MSGRLQAPTEPIASGLVTSSLAPRTSTEHLAGPSTFDFGKVSPGGVEQIEGRLFDLTNGEAPASAATWLRAKGGAKHFMEDEIVHRSLSEHDVVLATDQAKADW